MIDSAKTFLKDFYAFGKKKIFFLIACVLASSILEGISLLLIIPFLQAAGMSGGLSSATGNISAHLPSLNLQGGRIMQWILLCYVFIVIGEEFFRRYTTISVTALKAGFCRSLSDRFYEAFARARWQTILKQRRSDIANALTNELRTIDTGAMVFIQTLSMLPSILIQIVISFALAPLVTLAAFVLGLLFFYCMRPVNRKLGNVAGSLNEVLKDSLSDVNEHLSGIKEIKGYGAEKIHKERYSLKTRETEKKYVQFVTMFSTSNFIYNSSILVLLSIFLYAALTLFHVEIAKLVVIAVIFLRIWPLFSSFQTSFQFFVIMFPAWDSFTKRMEELDSAREELVDSQNVEPLELKEGIEVNDLSFSYGGNGKSALNGVSFSVPAHSFIAITGQSGSGKSTLIDILLGLLEPSSGDVVVDGKKLSSGMIAQWRRTIGFVPQDTFLFNGTVKENLLWAKPSATDEELWEALRMSAAEEFVRELPQGLETNCGDRGMCFSGGQRQRIALARALLRDPSLLILDEATSALDTENEKKIHDAIRGLHGRMTIIMVAHRLSTIQDADKIILMEDGAIREKGSFSELMGIKNGRFLELAGEFHTN